MRFKFFIYTITIQETKELNKGVLRASKRKTEIAQEKIKKAVKELKEEEKKITMYAVNKKSKVSLNTIKKYKELLVSN